MVQNNLLQSKIFTWNIFRYGDYLTNDNFWLCSVYSVRTVQLHLQRDEME